ncbi:MAG: hypothetical protein ACRDAU_17795 [Clostridium sp.]
MKNKQQDNQPEINLGAKIALILLGILVVSFGYLYMTSDYDTSYEAQQKRIRQHKKDKEAIDFLESIKDLDY